MTHAPSRVVCVVGVGFVGLTFAISLCEAGATVLGWEKDEKNSLDLSQGLSEVSEPGLNLLLTKHVERGTFRMINNAEDASVATVFVLTVGTPLKDGSINLGFIEDATNQIVPALKEQDLVVIRSTTAVGTCRDIVLPILEKSRKSIFLAMCPERTLEGKALEEMSSLPQIIGALNQESAAAAEDFFEILGPEIVSVESLEAAELTKLINNTYRDLMFGFANEIANIAGACGVNATKIINSANYNYPRSQIALPGLSGGPCLEKDPWILVESGKSLGVTMNITKSAREVNENTLEIFLDRKLNDVKDVENISILGLAFKGSPKTRDLRGSFLFPLVGYLSNRYPNAEIRGFDPAGVTYVPRLNVRVENDIKSCLHGVNLVIVLTNASSFDEIPFLISRYAKNNCIILDFWNREFFSEFLETQKYFSWGGET